MQLVRAAAPKSSSARMTVAGAAITGFGWLWIGASLGFLVFGTSLASRVFSDSHLASGQPMAGALVFVAALVAPAGFGIAGVSRLAVAADGLRWRSHGGPAHAAVAELGLEVSVTGPIRLPDGRVIQEVAVGPFGVAVFRALGSNGAPGGEVRCLGSYWEVRLPSGHWAPTENPVERATRDAEAVRRWLADDTRDHVVRTYAALVAPDGMVSRTPTCAVIASNQIAAYLGSLPVQRSLGPDRRAALAALVRSASV